MNRKWLPPSFISHKTGHRTLNHSNSFCPIFLYKHYQNPNPTFKSHIPTFSNNTTITETRSKGGKTGRTREAAKPYPRSRSTQYAAVGSRTQQAEEKRSLSERGHAWTIAGGWPARGSRVGCLLAARVWLADGRSWQTGVKMGRPPQLQRGQG